MVYAELDTLSRRVDTRFGQEAPHSGTRGHSAFLGGQREGPDSHLAVVDRNCVPRLGCRWPQSVGCGFVACRGADAPERGLARQSHSGPRGVRERSRAIPSPDGKHLAIWEASGSPNAWLLKAFG